MENPLISIVIPVKNGKKTIQKCLDAILEQTLFNQIEVIIIDSGSTDSTLGILKRYPFIRLYHIEPEDFNHGATRNYGVSLANGEFVMMTVQDARAANNKWLETMLVHFKDKNVAAVTGQQVVPHDYDKNPHQWFRPQNKTTINKINFENKLDFLNLPPQKQMELCKVDDVNTMYSKKILREVPFEHVSFGEDILWAKKALEVGYTIVYDNHARVYHYHHQTYKYAYEISYITQAFFYKTFGTFLSMQLKFFDLFLIIYRNFKFKAKFRWIFYNIKILVAKHNACISVKRHIRKGKPIKKMLVPIGQQKDC